jgi:hypothetical protein
MGMGILFLAIGLLVEITSHGTNMIGGFYMVLPGLFIPQLILSVGNSIVVQTSPQRKKLETMVPVVCGLLFSLFTYTIYVLMQAYFRYFRAGASEIGNMGLSGSGSMLLVAILLFFMEIYMGIVYKLFVLGMVVFIPAISFTVSTVGDYAEKLEQFAGRLGFGGIVLIGYAAILIGMLIAYGLMLLLYKKPFSKYAFGSAMRRAQMR